MAKQKPLYYFLLKDQIARGITCREAFKVCRVQFKLKDSDYATFIRRYQDAKKELASVDKRITSMAEIEASKSLAKTILTRNEGLLKLSETFRETSAPKDLVPLFTTVADYCTFSKRNDDDLGASAEILAGITKASECNPLYSKITHCSKKYVCVKGGSRSGKTYAICQMVVDWLLTGQFCGVSSIGVEGANLDIFREELTTLKGTVKRDLDTIISNKSLAGLISYRDKPCSYTYGGRTVRLMSATEDAAKGGKREFLWINEADTLNLDVARQLFMRGAKKIVFDYNPSDADSWLVNDFENEKGAYNADTEIITSTFLDNYFLDEYVKEELRRLKDVSPYLYNVYTLGEYAPREGVILSNVTRVGCNADVGEVLGCEYYTAYAMDLGGVDPTALVAVHLPKKEGDKWAKKIFVEQILYKPNPTIEEIKETLTNRGILDYIYTDSANAQMITELQRNGVKAVPTVKGSVFDGLIRLQGYEIIVKENAKELNNELRLYEWGKDSAGRLTGKPIDKHNHAIDAIRYAMKALLG